MEKDRRQQCGFVPDDLIIRMAEVKISGFGPYVGHYHPLLKMIRYLGPIPSPLAGEGIKWPKLCSPSPFKVVLPEVFIKFV